MWISLQLCVSAQGSCAGGFLRMCQEARGVMSTAQVDETRFLFEAPVESERTAGVEAAAPGRIGRVGHVAGQRRASAPTFDERVRNGNRGKQTLRVGVLRIRVKGVPI